MRSILLQSRRISSRSLLFPHPSSPSSSSSLPRRLNSSTSSTSSLQTKNKKSQPTSSSSSPPTTPTSSSPSPNPTQILSTSHYPSTSKPNVEPSHSPPSSAPSPAQEKLLQFSRVLSQAPPPSVDDVQFAFDLCISTYPSINSVALWDPARIEILVRSLSYASQVSPQTPEEGKRFAGLACHFIARLKDCTLVNLDLFGPEIQKELLSLVDRMLTRGQVDSLATFLFQSRTRDFNKEELDVIKNAVDRLPPSPQGATSLPLPTFRDWERGFGARLGELMEESVSSRSSNPTTHDGTDGKWLDRAKSALDQDTLNRGTAAGVLQARSVDSSSSSESLVVASEVYTKYAPPNKSLPSGWRQHGDILVRMLLLFSNHRARETPPFHLLDPILRELNLLPPSFIPPTPSFPSFAISLLPIASNLQASFLVVNSILRAQTVDPAVVPKIWEAFLASVERYSLSPTPKDIVESPLFQRLESSPSVQAGSALEDLIQTYLRRWRRAAKAGGRRLKDEERQFGALEHLVEERRKEEGTEWGASMYGTLMEVQVVVKRDWQEPFRIWKEVQEGAGVDARSVEMYLLACRETSSVDQAKLFFTAVQANPSMLPLFTPGNWSLFNSILLKEKDLPSLVESIVFQAASRKEENASPLRVEDLAVGVELAREVAGEEGKKAKEKLREAVGEKMFERAVKSLGRKEGGRQGKVVDAI